MLNESRKPPSFASRLCSLYFKLGFPFCGHRNLYSTCTAAPAGSPGLPQLFHPAADGTPALPGGTTALLPLTLAFAVPCSGVEAGPGVPRSHGCSSWEASVCVMSPHLGAAGKPMPCNPRPLGTELQPGTLRGPRLGILPGGDGRSRRFAWRLCLHFWTPQSTEVACTLRSSSVCARLHE